MLSVVFAGYPQSTEEPGLTDDGHSTTICECCVPGGKRHAIS